MKKKLFSVLLALAIVLTMATSVSALRSDDADYDVVSFGPVNATNMEVGTTLASDNNWYLRSGTAASIVADANETYGNVIASKNWKTTSTGSGKGIAFPRHSSSTPYTDVKIEFDMKVDSGNAIAGRVVYGSGSIKDGFNVMEVTKGGVLKICGETVKSPLGTDWNHYVFYINTDNDIITVYLNGALVVHNVTILGNEAYSCFRAFEFYNNGVNDNTTAVYTYVDNFSVSTRSVPDTTDFSVPSHYPSDMDYFETFNGIKYLDQPNIGANLQTSNSSTGTLPKDTNNWYVTDSGRIESISMVPYTSGGSDKYMDVEFSASNDDYIYFNLYNNGIPLEYKTITSEEVEVDDGEGGTKTETQYDIEYNEDMAYIYVTMLLGGFDSAQSTGADDRYDHCFYALLQTNTATATSGYAELPNTYVNKGAVRATGTSSSGVDISGGTPDRMHKFDFVFDVFAGKMNVYVDGKIVRSNISVPEFTSSSANTKVIRRMKIAAKHTDSLRIDNVGYKVYSKYEDEGKTNERTLGEVLGEIFATPCIAAFEVLSTSTKDALKVRACGNALQADGTAAGNMIVASYDGNRLTNVAYVPSVAGSRVDATFTNDLADTNKIACYFFGAQGTAGEMQPLLDAKYIEYDNSVYAE